MVATTEDQVKAPPADWRGYYLAVKSPHGVFGGLRFEWVIGYIPPRDGWHMVLSVDRLGPWSERDECVARVRINPTEALYTTMTRGAWDCLPLRYRGTDWPEEAS